MTRMVGLILLPLIASRTNHLELDLVGAGQSYLGRDNRRASKIVGYILFDVEVLTDGRHAIDRHNHIKTPQRRSARGVKHGAVAAVPTAITVVIPLSFRIFSRPVSFPGAPKRSNKSAP